MKLLTKQIIDEFRKTGSQEEAKTHKIIVKFFNPQGAGTWYATEYNEKDKIFFGYVKITFDGNEWGYFSLNELESFKGRFGLGIERDLHFGNHTIEDVISGNVS